jgi:hypothetical protein
MRKPLNNSILLASAVAMLAIVEAQLRAAPTDPSVINEILLRSTNAEVLISAVVKGYWSASARNDFKEVARRFGNSIHQLKDPGQRDAVTAYAIEAAKVMDPVSCYDFLSQLGAALPEQALTKFRRQLSAELIRLVFLERQSNGNDASLLSETVPIDQTYLGQQVGIVAEFTSTAGIKLSGSNFRIESFPSLALSFLDGSSNEQDRYDAYRALRRICMLAAKDGYVHGFCLTNETSLKKIVCSRGFAEVVSEDSRIRAPIPPELLTDEFEAIETRILVENLNSRLTKQERAQMRIEAALSEVSNRVEIVEQRTSAAEEELKRLDRKIDQKFEEALVAIKEAVVNRQLPSHKMPDGVRNDNDWDGIPDDFEDQLLQHFAPRVYCPDYHPCIAYDSGPPVGLDWLLKNVRFQGQTADAIGSAESGLQILQDKPIRELASWKLEWLREDLKWGEPAQGWCSLGGNQGIYGRVWRPWKDHTNYYSVQYFIFLTYNRTAETFGSSYGTHEGDWICADYGVEASNDRDVQSAKILHAIYHNHGRQFFMKQSAVPMEHGRPVLWLELQVNEPWPNRGNRGDAGWPRLDGFAANKNFNVMDVTSGGAQIAMDAFDALKGVGQVATLGLGEVFGCFGPDANSEDKVVREHGIYGDLQWKAWDTTNILNLGEQLSAGSLIFSASPYDREGAPESRHNDSICRFILGFPGKWGSKEIHGDNPPSPVFQSKMWKRAYDGPWNIFSGNPDDDQRYSYDNALSRLYGIPVFSNGSVHLFSTPGHRF